MRIGVAILLFLIAGLLGVAELLAVVDPAGAQMANDSDPFGMPHAPWYQHAIFTLAIVGCVAIALRLLRKQEVS